MPVPSPEKREGARSSDQTVRFGEFAHPVVDAAERKRSGHSLVGAGRQGCRGVAPAREPERPRGWHQQGRGPSLTAKAQRHAPGEGRMKDDHWRAYRGAWTSDARRLGPVSARGCDPVPSRSSLLRCARRLSGSAAVRIARATTLSGGGGTPTLPHSGDRHMRLLLDLSHIGRGPICRVSGVFSFFA